MVTLGAKDNKDKKEKIAIAIDGQLLQQIDSLIDGTVLSSRSQAITYFIEQGLKAQSIRKAVLLLHHTHHACVLKQHPEKQKPYFLCQLDLFFQAGVKKVIMLTQESEHLAQVKQEAEKSKLDVEVVIKDTKSTGDSVFVLKDCIAKENILVMSGDTYNEFDIQRMVQRHFEGKRFATMGLVNKENIENCGVVLLDGSLIIDFQENPSQPESHIINAGIYIFRPEIFDLLDKNTTSLEKDLFPKLAKSKQLLGYFTHGEYVHLSE